MRKRGDNVINLKFYICTLFGTLGGAIVSLLGGWTADLITLIIFMVIDFVMGVALALIWHKSNKSESGAISSKACWKGLCKKLVTLAFVMMAHRFDILLGVEYVRSAAVIGFITNEAISIIENAGLMGVPLPTIFKKAIDVLKSKTDEK